jgi:hypothetical protein
MKKYFPPLRLIRKDAELAPLRAMFKNEEFFIQNHNSTSDLLHFTKRPNEKQMILFEIWFSVNKANMFP